MATLHEYIEHALLPSTSISISFLLQLLMTIFCIYFFIPASCNSSSLGFTLVAGTLDEDFVRQHVKPSKYPFVTPEGVIFLTQDPSDFGHDETLYNIGRITYKKPLSFKDKSGHLLSFNSFFTFNITTITKYNESGDGIAFVLTTDKSPPDNSTGRFLGLMPEKLNHRDQRFMAVEFDTFQNLQEEIMDPSASHIGIDVSSLSSLKPIYNTADKSHPLYLYNNYTIAAWVSYNASTHLIQVWATNHSSNIVSQHPLVDPILNITHNLSAVFENYRDIYVAITAASGNNSQATILYSWNFTIIDTNEHKGITPRWRVPLIACLSSLLLVILLSLLLSKVIVPKWKRAMRERRRTDSIKDASFSVRQYRYVELKHATQNFSEKLGIGKGGFGRVYKGTLSNGAIVAIKKLTGLKEIKEKHTQEARRGSEGHITRRKQLKEFVRGFRRIIFSRGMNNSKHHNLLEELVREVNIISKIKHRNLLELRGWCWEHGEALLVFKYMPKGSLDKYLHGANQSRLDSETRFKIIEGVAAGLEYLHHGLEECVLHRDVKPGNVLLTETMEAKLGDFGLACLDEEKKTTGAAGTLGYMAPEVRFKGNVTEKGDVYSFGVLTLVVASGRRPLNDPNFTQYISHLVDEVWLTHQRSSILDVLDPSLKMDVTQLANMSSSSADQEIRASIEDEERQKWTCVLHLGVICTQMDPEERPSMREVHQALRNRMVLPLPSIWAFYPPGPSNSDSNSVANYTTAPAASLETESGGSSLQPRPFSSDLISTSLELDRTPSFSSVYLLSA